MCAKANQSKKQQPEQKQPQKQEKKYNSSLQSLMDIWNVLANYASADHPMSAGEVADHLKKLNGKHASPQTVKRLFPTEADTINRIFPHTVLREKDQSAVLLTYGHQQTLHVVLETPNAQPLWEGDMTAILTPGGCNPIPSSTLTRTLPSTMREYDQQKKNYDPEKKESWREYPPVSLAGVVARGAKNGKVTYIPASTWEATEETEAAKTTKGTGDEPKRGPTRKFFLESILSSAEWRILWDLILVYPYISEQQTSKFQAALKRLAPGVHNWSQTRYASKTANGVNFQHIQKLDDAIRDQTMVTVKYGKYRLTRDASGQWKPQLLPLPVNNGLMTVEPYAMMWSNGYYYLICSHTYKDKTVMRNLRVDRILEVHPLTKTFEKSEDFDPYIYRDRSPVMYPGKAIPIHLRCHTSLLNTLLDFFGTTIDSYSEKDDEGFTKVSLRASELGTRLFALQYADRVEVLEPESLREEVKNTLLAAARKYQQSEE